MIRSAISRSTLGFALAAGFMVAGAVAPAAAQQRGRQQAEPRIEFSKAFSAVAGDLDKALTEGAKSPAVIAAAEQARAAGTGTPAKAAAVAQVDAALGGAKAKLDVAKSAVSTPGDTLKLGQMTRTYGVLTADPALQYTGLTMMLDSGVLPATSVGQLQWLAGISAYQTGHYANAAKHIQQAKDGGFQDPQLIILLADAYKRSNNPAAALQLARSEIAAAQQAGTKPSEASIRTALQATYDAKQAGPAAEYATLLVRNYPSPEAWNVAISVVRATAPFQTHETLDLMRLMARTNSYKDELDYLEYIQAADPRRYPGEVLEVIAAGTSSGKLREANPTAANAKDVAGRAVAADKASLPSVERDARVASANAIRVIAAGDTFLTYHQPDKAIELYTLALTKPGADLPLVLTRLGIAQFDKGDYAGAQATFVKVEGTRKPLAELWSAYAAQKAAGK